MGRERRLLLPGTLAHVTVRGNDRLSHVYAKGFNLRHGRRDHVFGKRYGSKIQTSDEQIATVAYIARNPVEAGLCAHPAEWPWSNFGELRELAYGDTTLVPSALGELVVRGARLADELPKR